MAELRDLTAGPAQTGRADSSCPHSVLLIEMT